MYSCALMAQVTGKTTLAKSTKRVVTKADPISIGDQVPDITFENVLNYKKKRVKLSEFKGKIVILDMWSTTCASCIAAFPKIEKLQNEFQGKLQILLVNPHSGKYDTEERIKTVLQKTKSRTGYFPGLPIPIHDSIINLYFPHKTVPHYIWIGGDRQLLAISRAKDLTYDNISALLEGNKIKIPRKDDWAYDNEKPMLVDGNGGENGDFVYRALFTGYKEGIGFGSGIRINNDGNVTGVYMLNKSLRQLVNEAFSDILNNIKNNRVFLDVTDPARFNRNPAKDNLYCYDLTIPPLPRNTIDLSEHLRDDLKRYFNIKVHKELRKIKCLIVTVPSAFANQTSKYNEPDILLDNYSEKKYIRNHSVSDIIRILDQSEMPLIDETGISKQLIDIEFGSDFNISNFDTVIKALEKIGFDVKEEERTMEMVVISDK